MQYFDPEKFDVKVDPDPKRNEVDITYIVEEKKVLIKYNYRAVGELEE